MSTPQIHGKRRTFSASRAVEVQNETLTNIRDEDGATWSDMGRALGKSEDRAAAYANTSSPIDMPTLLAGGHEWGERFIDPFLALIGLRSVPCGSVCTTDDKAALTLSQLLPAIIEAEVDGITALRECGRAEGRHEGNRGSGVSRRAPGC